MSKITPEPNWSFGVQNSNMKPISMDSIVLENSALVWFGFQDIGKKKHRMTLEKCHDDLMSFLALWASS